ncbi:MAG: serine/threonine protein kinase [Actinobacteria bacterium]|nr:serine/threonine protein kinase [Actinomycetota bacterium]
MQTRLVAGRYRLLSPLGVGGMGTVWRAEDVVLGREVAVKEVTFPHGLTDEEREVLRERTRREARAAARLDHPSAVTVFDVVEEGDAPYLVMELVEARTLSQVVRSDGPLSPQRTAQVGLALLGALETAHAQGIVHRDVKPGNVLLCPDEGGRPGRVVLTDFGIASSPGDPSITSTGLLLGSPSYIAPERAKGLPPGPESDLWSLGATLFTAVEGRPPYDGGEPLLTVTAVVTGEHAPFVAAGPLASVLEGLLAREPEARLDVAAARAALQPLAESAAATTAQVAAAPMPEPAAVPSDRTTALPMREVREAAQASPQATPAAAGEPAAPEPVPAALPPHPPARPRPPLVLRPASPGPARAGPNNRVPVLALAAILLVGAAAVLGFALAGGPDGAPDVPPAAAPPSAAAPSAVPSEPPSPPPSPSSRPTPAIAVPAGWTSYTDDERGWSIGVPPGFTQGTRNDLIQFRNDDTRRTLRVDYTDAPKQSALAAWQAASPQFAGSLTDYQQLRLENVNYKGLDAADLEFTYFDQTTLRVLDRTFITADGEEAFALYWQVRAEDWEAALPLFEQMAATFQPGA